ncbi:MAG: DUF489 family protein [Pseudomonadales bacterium]
MSNTSMTDQAIVLAGIAQAAMLGQSISARRAAQTRKPCNAPCTAFGARCARQRGIFINKKHLHLGLKTVREAFERDSASSAETLRYCASMLHLQKNLVKNPTMLDTLRKRIQQLQKQIDFARRSNLQPGV